MRPDLIVLLILLLNGCLAYAHDVDIGVRLVAHYDEFHWPDPCHIHIYEDGTRREWDVTDETRLPVPNPESVSALAIVEADDLELPELTIPQTLRHRLVLVITEIRIQADRITTIKACSNSPNYPVLGRLKWWSGRGFVEIPVESRIYEKPVWDKKLRTWNEQCKTFSVNIPVTQLLLVSGSAVDQFDVKLPDGVYHRHYQRLNTPTAYPYFDVVDGRSAKAWKPAHVKDLAPSAPRLQRVRNLPTTWGHLKSKR